jgi:hypothetical protein
MGGSRGSPTNLRQEVILTASFACRELSQLDLKEARQREALTRGSLVILQPFALCQD